MKQIISAVALSFIASAALATDFPSQNVIVENGTYMDGRCASVFQSECNASTNVTVNGGVVNVNGEAVVVKGKDGERGAQGVQGLKGDRGEKGDTGIAGATGLSGKDGKDAFASVDSKTGVIKYSVGEKEAVADLVAHSELDAAIKSVPKYDDTAIRNSVTQVTQEVKRVDNRITKVEQRIDGLEQALANSNKQLKKAVAGNAAIANLPQAPKAGKLTFGAAVGGYDSENALAIGASYNHDNVVVIKASISVTESKPVYGAGVAFVFD